MIDLTPKASDKLKNLQQEAGGTTVRLAVKTGGCLGHSYKLDFDSAQKELDKAFEKQGVKFVIDNESLVYLQGMTIDYDDGLQGKGFKFENPNVKKSCGCGSSFVVK